MQKRQIKISWSVMVAVIRITCWLLQWLPALMGSLPQVISVEKNQRHFRQHCFWRSSTEWNYAFSRVRNYDHKKRSTTFQSCEDNDQDTMLIPEGGASEDGIRGAEEILSVIQSGKIFPYLLRSGYGNNACRNCQ